MRQKINSFFKLVIKDKIYLSLFIIMALIGLSFFVYILINTQPTDLSIWIRYTGFGDVNYYRGKWYLFYSWAILDVALLFMGTVYSYKFINTEKNRISYFTLAINIFILIIAWITLSRIYGLPN